MYGRACRFGPYLLRPTRTSSPRRQRRSQEISAAGVNLPASCCCLQWLAECFRMRQLAQNWQNSWQPHWYNFLRLWKDGTGNCFVFLVDCFFLLIALLCFSCWLLCEFVLTHKRLLFLTFDCFLKRLVSSLTPGAVGKSVCWYFAVLIAQLATCSVYVCFLYLVTLLGKSWLVTSNSLRLFGCLRRIQQCWWQLRSITSFPLGR